MSQQEPNKGGQNSPTPPPAAATAAEQALNAAQQAVTNLQQSVGAETAQKASTAPQPFVPKSFEGEAKDEPARGIDLLADVNLNVKIELGRTHMLVEDVLKLTEGAVVELDKLAGDPVDVYVNERHIARGEVLVLNDNFCVRINEIIPSGEAEVAVKK